MSTWSERIGALLVVALGFAARLVNLAGFDFWFDEVGQVLAGRAESPLGAVRVAADHLGAAPLDYLITWLGVRLVGESEFGLRWIAAAWSTLAIVLIHRIGDRLERGVGAWAALLVALSPLAIRHAQEVRFYSLALLLCALGFWFALHVRLRSQAWVAAMAGVLALGLYAHVYTMLVWPAVAWTLWSTAPRALRRKVRLFGAAAALALALFAPWLIGELLSERVPPFPDAAGFNLETARRMLAGWEMPNFSPVPVRNTANQPFPYGIALLHIAALVLALRRARGTPLWLGLVVVYFGATLAVVANDMRVGYFFAPRQVLNLLVLRALFAGWVLSRLIGAVSRRAPWFKQAAAVGVLLCALPTLAAYYANYRDKSNAAQVAEAVAQLAPRERWIAPHYDHLTIDYYLERRGQPRTAWQHFPAENVEAWAAASALSHRQAVVVLQAAYATSATLSALRSVGFSVIVPRSGVTGNEHFVVLVRN